MWTISSARTRSLTPGKEADIIAIDAYHQPYVPFYLATQEFFRLVRSRLRPGGIVALNVATVPGDHRLAMAFAVLGSVVDGIVVDWETRGKEQRQASADTQINRDTPADLQRVRRETTAPIVCRINGVGETTGEPIPFDRLAAVPWARDGVDG